MYHESGARARIARIDVSQPDGCKTVDWCLALLGARRRPPVTLSARGWWTADHPFVEQIHRVVMPIAPGFEGTPVHPAIRTVPDLADLYHAIEVDEPECLLRLVNAFLERGEACIVNLGDEAA